MVAKSKLANKQSIKKVAKKSKTNANARKPKKVAKKVKPKVKQPAPVVQESDSDHGEDMLEMVEEEDLNFLKTAISSQQYTLFSNIPKTVNKGNRRKVKHEDENLENNYENEADDQPRTKVKNLLPIKTKKGIIQRQVEQEDVEEEVLDEEVNPDAHNEGSNAESDTSDHLNLDDISLITKLDTSEAITPAELLLRRAEILDKMKLHIGTLSSGLLEAPEEKLTNFRTLIKLLDDSTPEVFITIRKLVIVSLLEVFKDLLPAYQIKPQEAEGVRMKKDTLKLQKFEVLLLQYYKKYLQKLEKFAKALYKKRGDNRMRTPGEKNIGEVAVHAMCDLLIAHPYFNFAPNLVQAVVPFLNNVNRNVRLLVATAIKTVFKEDKKEEISLQIVRVINHYLKSHSHNVNTEMLEIFLSLRIKDVNLDQDKEIEIKNKKIEAHKTNILTKLSKKERKRKKRLQSLEHELLETKAEENKQTKLKNLTEITKFLFGIYFRILKSSKNPRVLGVCLEGLAKFAHCINLEFYVDIVNVLDKLLAEDWLGSREKLHCIQTVFAILGGQGEALNIDPTRFYVRLYANMLEAHAGRNERHFAVLLHTLMVGIVHRRKKITNKRIIGFVKRLALLALQSLHNGALGSLAVVKSVMQLCKAVDILLDVDNEGGDGMYNAELEDPEYCNASSTALYELTLLARHYHPIVAKYALNIANGVPASGEGSLPPQYGKCTPDEVYTMFDMSQMAFNPSIPVPKQQPISSKVKKHRFVDSNFRSKCYKRLKQTRGTYFMEI